MIGINGRYLLKNKRHGLYDINSGGIMVEMVPTLVWYQHNVMIRAQIHTPVYIDLNGTQLAPTSGFQIGVGIVY